MGLLLVLFMLFLNIHPEICIELVRAVVIRGSLLFKKCKPFLLKKKLALDLSPFMMLWELNMYANLMETFVLFLHCSELLQSIIGLYQIMYMHECV